MTPVYLSLGANVGDRLKNLRNAIIELKALTIAPMRLSSVYETPALLPELAPSDWNRPFLNCIVEIQTDLAPKMLLEHIQRIERQFPLVRNERWAPRPLDIDIVYWHGIEMDEPTLKIPHIEATRRSFVLDGLAELNPFLTLSVEGSVRTLPVLQLARQLAQHQPRLMAVLNITPDSFSDGGNSQTAEAALATVDTWKDSYPAIIDIGGESTRPNAVLITAQEEWQRIEAPLLALRERYRDEDLRPKISIDTRKPEIAALALDQHVDIINDVSGFADPGLLEVIQSHDCQVVLMHSLSVPADPNLVLKSKEPPISEICRWFDQQLERFEKAGIDLKRVTLDPGLGFGKTALQSIEILRSVQALHRYNLPILIGHSRKSLLANFGPRLAALRDPETVGVSLAVAAKGIEVLRVHDPILHHRTLLAWNHVV